MPSHRDTEKEALLQELATLPGDFVQAAISAAYFNPVRGVTQLKDHIYQSNKSDKQDTESEHKLSTFGSLRWHAEQLGGAVGTMVPYYLLNKTVGLAGVSKFLTPFATGALMEGVFRPVEKVEGDFSKARIVNALTGTATFGTLGHLPGYLKSRDVLRFQIEQPWLINSFTSDLKRHIASGAAAGLVDTESRSIFSGKGLNTNAQEIAQSVYAYGALGGLMRSATEVAPALTKGRTINDIVQTSSYLSDRAKVDPVAKELIIEHGEKRVNAKDRSTSQDIYDLFAHAKVAEAIELKSNLENGNLIEAKGQTLKSIPELLTTNLPLEEYPFYSYHPTRAYSEAFKNFSKKGTSFLGVGFDSVVIKLEDGTALKISSQLRTNGKGNRFFDMPILEEGVFETEPIVNGVMEDPTSGAWQQIQLQLLEESGRGVNYLVQPVAFTKIPVSLCERFRNHLSKIGHDFWDWQRDGMEKQDQLGFFDGRIALLDYFAVEPTEVVKARKEKKAREESKSVDQRIEELLGAP